MRKALFIIPSVLGSYRFQLKTEKEKGRRGRKDEWHQMGCWDREEQSRVGSIMPIY